MEKPNQGPGTAVTTVVAREDASSAVIRSPREFESQVKLWQQDRCHVLTPFANFQSMPAHYGLVPALVHINPNEAAGDVYVDRQFCKDGEVAIAKLGLSKLAMAAGMSIRTERTDNRQIANLWEVRATVRFVGIDGTPQTLDATEECDLRDGTGRADKALGRDKNQSSLMAARSKGLRLCEAKAINAAIRQFGVRQKYTKAELAKPFAVVRVVFLPDMADPLQRQMVTERAMGGSATIWGASVPALSAAATEPEHLDTIGAVDGPAAPAAGAQPKAPEGRLVLAVEHDQEAARFDVTLEGGEILTTDSAGVARDFTRAKAAGARVKASGNEQGELVSHAILEPKGKAY